MRNSVSKHNYARETVAYIWRHVRRYPKFLWGMLLVMPVAVLVNRFLPALIVAGILDRLARHDFTPGDAWGSFGPELLLAIGLSCLGGIFIWRLVAYCNWRLEGYVLRDIAQEGFDHLMKLDANFHANHFAGSLTSQSNKLIGAYTRIVDTSVFSVGTLMASLLFTSILLVGRAPLFVVLLIAFVLFYTVGSIFITKEIRKLSSRHANAETDQTGYLADSITNIMAIKSFAADDMESRRY